VLLTGGIHGDEVNGVEIVRQIVSKGYNKPEVGMVICMPVVNIFGFLNQTRQFPDGRDLNRVFPGSKRGSLASRFAFHIMQDIVPHADYCIDFHTGGASRFNLPQIRVTAGDVESLQLAKKFAPPAIIQSKIRTKSFRAALVKRGKKVLLFEGGKSLYLSGSVTKMGINGALRVMQELGMRDFTTELNGKVPQQPLMIERSKWVRAKYSGMYHATVKPGDLIEKGDSIGSISDPFGDFEKIMIAPNAGCVICVNQAPIVNQGDALIHLSF
jgi:hypothetical protein